MDTVFERLVRFRDAKGEVWYGEAPDTDAAGLVGKKIITYEGGLPWDSTFRKSGIAKEVTEVLCPLEATPIFLCVGLNYRKHAEEAGMDLPQVPMIFHKGPDALAGPFEDIPIHPECPNIDYEAELSVVIGKRCKNIQPSEDPLAYVLGYTVGNDISCRYWQGRGGAPYSKSFDSYGPVGPAITSLKIIPDPNNLHVTTKVNGEIRQDASTDDLVFDVSTTLRFLSRGRTLRPGTIIMTGTPAGVGFGKKPQVWLKDGDIVEVEIGGLGSLKNKMVIPTQSEVRL